MKPNRTHPLTCCLLIVVMAGCANPVPKPLRDWRPQDARLNADGLRPGRERMLPLRRIADPVNLISGVPALEVAAMIKHQEDLAPQKIKAIRYLGTIGCGCYDADGKVTDALIAAMDDCTEEVRLITMQTIQGMAVQGPCPHCNQNNCCNEPIVAKLADIAFEYTEAGVPIEPSARVREAAAAAFHACCPHPGPAVPVEPTVPGEDPDVEMPDIEPSVPPPVPPPGAVPPGAVPPPATLPETSLEGAAGDAEERPQPSEFPPVPRFPREATRNDGWQPTKPVVVIDLGSSGWETADSLAPAELAESVRHAEPIAVPDAAPRTAAVSPAEPRAEAARPAPPSRHSAWRQVSGTIQQIDLADQTARITFPGSDVPAAGERVMIYHRYEMGRIGTIGQLEVVSVDGGSAVARPVGGIRFDGVAVGDSAVLVK